MKIGPLMLSCLTAAAVFGIASSISLGVWRSGMPGPGLFPLVSSTLLLGGLGATFFEPRQSEAEQPPIHLARFFGYGCAIIGYVGLLVLVGTLPAVFVFLCAIIALVERLSWTYALTVASATTIACWAVFVRLLGVPLPAGIWS